MDQLKYYCEHPPRCLSAFQAMVADIADIVVGCHGELMNTLFRLKCQCGATHHSILGHYWRNPDFNNVLVFLSPLALRCEACRREAQLIDTDIHGYDGEMNASCTMRGEGERKEFACVECGPQSFEVFAGFEHPDDLFDEEYDGYRGHESDLFTSFSLVGVCAKCGQRHNITDFECA